MHLTISQRKNLGEQSGPAILAIALVALGVVAIPISHPVDIHNGVITPGIAAPGDKVEVSWTQDWKRLCPLTVTREFTGADSFKKTATKMDYRPPSAIGVHRYQGAVIVPELPAGPASYHSIIEPHCWLDAIWQRSFKTPDLPLTIVKATPPGPR